MWAILALVLFTSASAIADPVFVCKAPDGSKALQDHPCDQPEQHRMGVTIVQAPPPKPLWAGCAIYGGELNRSLGYAKATISNRDGAA